MLFDWFRSKKSASNSASAQDEDDSPPQIRKPQHAYRDARMAIPVAEREYYETIQARKRFSVTPSITPSSSTWSSTNGKGKGKSTLGYDSGFPSSISIPGMDESESASPTGSNGSKTDLTGLWDLVAEGVKQGSSTASASVAEISTDAASREARADE